MSPDGKEAYARKILRLEQVSPSSQLGEWIGTRLFCFYFIVNSYFRVHLWINLNEAFLSHLASLIGCWPTLVRYTSTKMSLTTLGVECCGRGLITAQFLPSCPECGVTSGVELELSSFKQNIQTYYWYWVLFILKTENYFVQSHVHSCRVYCRNSYKL